MVCDIVNKVTCVDVGIGESNTKDEDEASDVHNLCRVARAALSAPHYLHGAPKAMSRLPSSGNLPSEG